MIASFTWILLDQEPKEKDKTRVMVDFMKWALTEGQKYCADLGYAPLPQAVVQAELEALNKVH